MPDTKEKIIEDIYTISAKGEQNGADYLLEDFPCPHTNFVLIDEILKELDVTKLNGQFLWQLTFVVAPYINYLKNYVSFYNRATDECRNRGYSEKRIQNLFKELKAGGHRLYDHNVVRPSSYKEKDNIILEQRIALAKEVGDVELLTILERHKSHLDYYNSQRDKYFRDLQLIGTKAYEKKAIIALRAMADKLEEPGQHSIIVAELPVVPIFEGEDEWGASITVSINAKFMVG